MELKLEKFIIPIFIVAGLGLIYKGLNLNKVTTQVLSKKAVKKNSLKKKKINRTLTRQINKPHNAKSAKTVSQKKNTNKITQDDKLTKAISISSSGEPIGPNGLVCEESSCLVMDTIKGKVSFYDLEKKSLNTFKPQFKYIKNGLVHKNKVHVIHGQHSAELSTYDLKSKKWKHTKLPLQFNVLNNIISDIDDHGNISLQVGAEYYSIQSDNSIQSTPGRPLSGGNEFVQIWMPEFNQFVVNITDKEGKVTLSHKLDREYESIDNYVVEGDSIFIVFTKAGSQGSGSYSYVIEKINANNGAVLAEVSFPVQSNVHIETPISIDKRSGQVTFTDYVNNKLKVETVNL